MKRALITGITGQDGSYLSELLLQHSYEVYGLVRKVSNRDFANIAHMLGKIHLISGDISDDSSLHRALREVQPEEIYHLAAQTQVGTSFTEPTYTSDVTGVGATRVFEAARNFCPTARIYNACSSEMFGGLQGEDKLTLKSLFKPQSPYAAAKVFAYHMGLTYRNAYKMHISNGILFNHESPRRGLEFVTRKISYGVSLISQGKLDKIPLGNIRAKRDWGYAPEYVEAMWLMLQQDEPDDYIIATGETHSVEEFLKLACAAAGLDEYTKYAAVQKSLMRPLDVPELAGDSSKATERLGWKSKTSIAELVRIMVAHDMERVSKGESFPREFLQMS